MCKSNKIKISVITVNRNNGEGLRKTIESVAGQAYSNFEYIVIDGNSTDNSVSIIKEYSQIINYWISEPDTGIYNAMNKGIKNSNGYYSLFLNSGDTLFCQNTFQEIEKEIEDEDVVYGNTSQESFQIKSFADIFERNICHQAAFIKTSLLKQDPYKEDYKIASDYDFFLRSMYMGKNFKFVNQTICVYDTNGLSSKSWKENRVERESIHIANLPEEILLDYRNLKSLKATIGENNFHSLAQYPEQSIFFKIATRIYLSCIGQISPKSRLK